MNKPRIDFIGIGAPKCGTTWLSACLAEHPQIGFAADKEVYYFADSEARTFCRAGFNRYERGVEWYHRQFATAKAGARVCGEYSASYMYDPRSHARIRDYNPEIRILVTLRDPVDMVYSWYWHNRTGLIAGLPDTFEEAMTVPYFRKLGSYHQALGPFFREFPATNIHVIVYDDIQNDPAAVLRRLFAFLGVETTFRSSRTQERVNTSKTTRFRSLQRLGHLTYTLLRRARPTAALVTSRPFEKAVLTVYERINSVSAKYPPIHSETRAKLTEIYRPDLERLETLLDRDLTAWYRRV